MSKKEKYTPEEKKLLRRLFWRSWPCWASYNMVKMMGYGMTRILFPAYNLFYKGRPDKIKEAMVRNMEFFNITPNIVTFVVGLVAGMEKENSLHDDFDTSSITAIKTALIGPLSGIGDAIFWVTLRTIATALAIGLAAAGQITGAIIYLLVINVPHFIIRYKLTYVGYDLGAKSVAKAYESGMMKKLTKAATIIGMVMVGYMAASFISVGTGIQFTVGESVTTLQSILDGIMPQILSLGLILGVVALLRKGVTANKILLGIIVVGIAGALLGIFAL